MHHITRFLLSLLAAGLLLSACGLGRGGAPPAPPQPAGGQGGVVATAQNAPSEVQKPQAQGTALPLAGSQTAPQTGAPALTLPAPGQQGGGPAPTETGGASLPTEPPPTEAGFEAKGGSSDSLKQAWAGAYQLPPGVPFSVTTTEAEIEALIAEKLAASGYGSNISNLNVTLDNGQIGVSFTLTISQQVGPKAVNASANGSVIFSATIDAQGHLVLTVVSADFGKLSLPPEMLAPLNDALSQAITGAGSSAQGEVTLTSLVIDAGVMTVKGYVTPKP